MANPPAAFTVGSLYLAGFAQARAPHVGLILPSSAQSAHLIHIRIDRVTSPNWVYQARPEPLTNNMFLNSLLKIHDVSDGAITLSQLEDAAKEVPVPDNDTFGECGPWICKVVEELHRRDLVKLSGGTADELKAEFDEFAAGNRAYARRDRFPNVQVSTRCS
ncbi:hypothetical protein NMY22_g8706 [Coprinellus aureogranulatus]|nr:hypothetical protein NMY22_g8706 [Coprinellus aureogranulatus]